MSLYNKVKSILGECKGVISDTDTLLINRRDFHITQISVPNAVLAHLNVKIGYPYRVLISLLDQFAANMHNNKFRIVLADPSLLIAAFYVWLRAGGTVQKESIVYAPQGIAKFNGSSSLFSELIQEFYLCVDENPDSYKKMIEDQSIFTYVLGNTKTQTQTIYAADRYNEIKQGMLVLKDYAKIDAYDEREYLESKLIFPAITYEGHAFCFKIDMNQ